MTPHQAEQIGIAALGWLCSEDTLLPVFLAASGASVADLRGQIAAADGPEPPLLMAALDFVLMRDDTVIACAQAMGLRNDQLAQAQAVLSGTAQMNWT